MTPYVRVMSRAAIGVYDGNVIKVITVENEGNPGYTGAILYIKYQTKDLIEKLLKLGDLRDLNENIEPPDPAMGHYVIKNGKKTKEARIQDRTIIAKYRDERQYENGEIVRNKPTKPRIYPKPKSAAKREGVEFVYLFDIEREEWETWGVSYKNKKFERLKVDYKHYARNLEAKEVISDITSKELEKLRYIENQK